MIFNGFNEFYFGGISRLRFFSRTFQFALSDIWILSHFSVGILLGFPSLRFLFVLLFVYTVMFAHVSFLNSLSQLNFVLDVGVSRGCVCTALLRADSNKIKLSL